MTAEKALEANDAHWLFSTERGTPVVIVQAADEDGARERYEQLRQSAIMPASPKLVEVNEFPAGAWFSDAWFHVWPDLKLVEQRGGLFEVAYEIRPRRQRTQ